MLLLLCLVIFFSKQRSQCRGLSFRVFSYGNALVTKGNVTSVITPCPFP